MSAENATATLIDDPLAIVGGYMVIISVSPIQEKTAERWWTKRDLVWDFAQRQFHKSFPASDALRKISDVEYLIVQATEQGAAAQFKAIDFLRTILTFFLGVATISELNLSVVKSIKDGVIETEPLSEAQIQAVTCSGLGVSVPAQEGPRVHPPNEFVIKLTLDRSYEIITSIDPIWSVYKHAVVSYHLRPLVFEVVGGGVQAADMDEISLRDVLGIDCAIVKNAAAVIRASQLAGYSFALHIPIHFRCMRSLSCRSEMARILPLYSDIRRFLAFNIVGVPDGAPTGALADAVSALRPHALGVMMQPAAMNEEVRRWRGLGLAGIAFDFFDEAQRGAEAISRVKRFGDNCSGVATALIGYAISTKPMLMAAWSAGFTHISGSPITDKFPDVRAAVRFRPTDIFS